MKLSRLFLLIVWNLNQTCPVYRCVIGLSVIFMYNTVIGIFRVINFLWHFKRFLSYHFSSEIYKAHNFKSRQAHVTREPAHMRCSESSDVIKPCRHAGGELQIEQNWFGLNRIDSNLLELNWRSRSLSREQQRLPFCSTTCYNNLYLLQNRRNHISQWAIHFHVHHLVGSVFGLVCSVGHAIILNNKASRSMMIWLAYLHTYICIQKKSNQTLL